MRRRKFPISLLPAVAPARGRGRSNQASRAAQRTRPTGDVPKLDWSGCDQTSDGMVPADEAFRVTMSACGVSHRLARALLAGLRHHWRASERAGAPAGEHRYLVAAEVEECVALYRAGTADVNYEYVEPASIAPKPDGASAADVVDELAS